MDGAARPIPTVLSRARSQLAQLCPVLGLDDREAEIGALMRLVLGPNADRDIGRERFASDVCDDHSPYEFSISVDARGTELRVLMETVGEHPTLSSTQAACVAMTDTLASRLQLSLARLREVEALFVDEAPQGLFSRWHALEFRRGRAPSVKLYLNPQIRGPGDAASVTEQALTRLGFGQAWVDVRRRACRGAADELKYFSLDLDHGPTARVKVYVRHHQLRCDELEAYFTDARDYTAGAASEFCRAMLGGDEPFADKPVFTCLSWPDPTLPPKPTLYAPIAGYVSDDAEARSRIVDFMASRGLSTSVYEAALDALLPRQPGKPIQSYVSVRWDGGAPRMTVYMSPNAYASHDDSPSGRTK